MPNPFTPTGLVPVMLLDASSWSGKARTYFIPSTDGSQFNLYDGVKLAANADVNGVPAVAKWGGTEALVGVIVAAAPVTPNNLNLTGQPIKGIGTPLIPATKTQAYYVLVTDDPDTVYMAVDDALDATKTVATKANNNCNMTIANPSAGVVSASVLATASFATTNTLPIALLGLYEQTGNTFAPGARYLCKINNHQLANARTGV